MAVGDFNLDSHHSLARGFLGPRWVTFGRSRVRESRTLGSVGAKAEWLSYPTTTIWSTAGPFMLGRSWRRGHLEVGASDPRCATIRRRDDSVTDRFPQMIE